METDVRISFEFEKAAAGATGEYVRGWASVTSKDGKPYEDTDKSRIDIEEIRKAAHKFVTEARLAKAMHKGVLVGEVVESVIVDDAFAKAMGMSDTRRGWWIGMQIHDADTKAKVKKGIYKAFSIGGRATVVKADG